MGNHAAGTFLPLEHSHRVSRSAQEHSCRKARGSRADYCGLPVGLLFRRLKGRENPIESARNCFQFCLPDQQALLIVVAHALVRAVMGADGSRDMRQRIPVHNNACRLFRIIFQHRLQISRDILPDGASFPARSRETVEERKRPAGLSLRQRFDRLPVQPGCCHTFIQSFHRFHIHAPERFASAIRQALCNLRQSLISARFQDRCRHGNRPDSRLEQVRHVVDISAA